VKYYYLVASLPLLTLGDPPPISVIRFRSDAGGELAEDDARELALVMDESEDPGRSPFARAWRNAETQIRNACVTFRAGRYGEDPRRYARSHEGFDVSVEDGVRRAFEAASPLDRERALDRLRWRIADDLALPDPFGLPAVLAFGVKLKMAERWAEMDDEVGGGKIESWVRESDARVEDAMGSDVAGDRG